MFGILATLVATVAAVSDELDSFAMQRAINETMATKSRKTILEAKNLISSSLKLYGVQLFLNVTLPPQKPKIKELPTAQQVVEMIRGTDIELPSVIAYIETAACVFAGGGVYYRIIIASA